MRPGQVFVFTLSLIPFSQFYLTKLINILITISNIIILITISNISINLAQDTFKFEIGNLRDGFCNAVIVK